MSAKQKLQRLDEQLSYNIFKRVPKTKRWRSILKTLEYSCHGLLFFVLTSIGLFVFPKHQKVLSHLFAGLCLDIFYVAITKALSRRRRPTYAIQSDQFMMVLSDKHSFPSGHATRAMFLACFFSSYFDSLPLTILIVGWAVSVCTSRVLLGRHYLFDVLCGMTFGLVHYHLQFGPLNFLNKISEWVILSFLSSQFGNSNDSETGELFSDDQLI